MKSWVPEPNLPLTRAKSAINHFAFQASFFSSVQGGCIHFWCAKFIFNKCFLTNRPDRKKIKSLSSDTYLVLGGSSMPTWSSSQASDMCLLMLWISTVPALGLEKYLQNFLYLQPLLWLSLSWSGSCFLSHTLGEGNFLSVCCCFQIISLSPPKSQASLTYMPSDHTTSYFTLLWSFTDLLVTPLLFAEHFSLWLKVSFFSSLFVSSLCR